MWRRWAMPWPWGWPWGTGTAALAFKCVLEIAVWATAWLESNSILRNVFFVKLKRGWGIFLNL